MELMLPIMGINWAKIGIIVLSLRRDKLEENPNPM
jgi:hypothetical protein